MSDQCSNGVRITNSSTRFRDFPVYALRLRPVAMKMGVNGRLWGAESCRPHLKTAFRHKFNCKDSTSRYLDREVATIAVLWNEIAAKCGVVRCLVRDLTEWAKEGARGDTKGFNNCCSMHGRRFLSLSSGFLSGRTT